MRATYLTIAFLFFSILCLGQGRAFYVGLQPSLRTQDYYNQGTFDVNVVPIVAQVTITTDLDIRLTSILEYRIPAPVEQTNLGFEAALPIAINAKMGKDIESEGLYLAPFYSYYANKKDQLNVHSFGVEPGYMWVFDHKWGLSVGFQFGGKRMRFQAQDNYWKPQLGLKLILGYWFRKDVVLGI